jgi:hypothetical protein
MWNTILLSTLVLPTIACSRGVRPEAEPEKALAPEKQERQSPPEPITAVVHSIPQVEALIASHGGKVIVIDLWAMW